MKRLEAILDAVAFVNGYFDPESEAYDLRNPLLLPAHPPFDGKRRFPCHKAGYCSSVDRIRNFCLRHPNETLGSLLEFFDVNLSLPQERALDFMSRCLNNNVSIDTPLNWFLENDGQPATTHSR